MTQRLAAISDYGIIFKGGRSGGKVIQLASTFKVQLFFFLPTKNAKKFQKKEKYTKDKLHINMWGKKLVTKWRHVRHFLLGSFCLNYLVFFQFQSHFQSIQMLRNGNGTTFGWEYNGIGGGNRTNNQAKKKKEKKKKFYVFLSELNH